MAKITKKEGKKIAFNQVQQAKKMPFFPQPKQKAIRRAQGR